ncbi:uncharacterized protein PRD47_008642 [Ara ararauna]
MAHTNCSQVTEFSLVGFTEDPVTQVNLFLLFLLTYLVTILGNLGIIILIRASPHLHSPMYYFLGNLAFVDLCSSTIITPKMLVDLMSEKKNIAYAGCVAQVFLFDFFGMTECFLLASMAYDRYVAICHPLLYPTVMSPKCCFQLVTGSYLVGLTNGVGQTISMSTLSFCSSSTIDLFFCDISPLISLSTSNTTLSHIILTTAASLFGVPSILVVLLSYVAIIVTILSINSAECKYKAFSTCTSHLTTVSVFFMHLLPSSDSSRGADKWAVVLYTVVTPMLNPLIYSLRNKEVKEALRKLFKSHKFGCKKPTEDLRDLVNSEVNAVHYFLSMQVSVLMSSKALSLPLGLFFDICCCSIILPKMQVQILALEKTISFSGCAAQLCFVVTFGVTECLLLAVMAYDRYVAICKHLLYPAVMCGWMCWWLVAGSYAVGVFHAVTHTTFIFTFSFCHSNVINHYFCDIAPLLALCCSNTHTYEVVILALVSINCLSTMTIIFISYASILPAVLRMCSKEGRRKAFFTCTSHLMVVSMFYGAILFMYLCPRSSFVLDENKRATLFYTFMTPMLNHLIYSLRSREVKAALMRAAGRRRCSKEKMAEENQTKQVTELTLVGLTDDLRLQVPLFILFLLIYFITLVGNLGMVVLIRSSAQLRSPMYFFLSNLSLLDACYSSVVAPKALKNLLMEKKTISVIGCATQLYFFIAFGTTECFLLAAMAYDRYTAICKPLLYSSIMSHRVCMLLVVSSYVLGLLHSWVHTEFTFSLPLCQPAKVNHFYCKITPVLALSCSDTRVNRSLIFGLGGLVEVVTISAVLASYVFILAAVSRISSAQGRYKAFSTCTSHLAGVTIFHGSILALNFRPGSDSSLSTDKVFAVFYSLVVPMLNPLIYSLRNREVKKALRDFVRWK